MTHDRKSLRAPVSLSPRYRSASSFELVEGRCTDLSDGGMFIAADLPCDNGTLIKFECQVEGRSEMLRGVGRVVWRRTAGDTAHPSGMGLKFVKLEDGCKELILSLVEDASKRGSVVPEQPMAAALRQTDSYRPSNEPPAPGAEPGAADATKKSDRPAAPLEASSALAAAPAASADVPAGPAAAVTAVATSATPGPAEKPQEPAPAAQQPSAAGHGAPHARQAPEAKAATNNMPIMLALALGGGLLLWLLFR